MLLFLGMTDRFQVPTTSRLRSGIDGPPSLVNLCLSDIRGLQFPTTGINASEYSYVIGLSLEVGYGMLNGNSDHLVVLRRTEYSAPTYFFSFRAIVDLGKPVRSRVRLK